MSAERLREAAALMRSRAEAARYWQMDSGVSQPLAWHVYGELVHQPFDPAHAGHIASWHPAVALAVAELLESDANSWDAVAHEVPDDMAQKIAVDYAATLAVATAYLGGAS